MADGSPAELKKSGPGAGSVRVVIASGKGAEIRAAIEGIPGVDHVETGSSDEAGFRGRVFPVKGKIDTHELARVIAQMAISKQWVLEELHQEEGKLDEVFRAITRTEG